MIDKNFHIPFFILGNPRSGTSLFRLMLNCHPNIIVPPESGFLQWWFTKYKKWTIMDSSNKISVEEYVGDILNSKKMEDWHLNREKLISDIIKFKPDNYAKLSSLIYLNYKNNIDYDSIKIGDKNNYYIRYLKILKSIYPQAKYIHLIRDGRDVACSYIKIQELKSDSKYKPDLVTDITEIALEWKNNIKKIESFLSNKKHLTIRYEDLIKNTEKSLNIVCEFIEIPYKKQMLNFYRSEFNDEPKSTIDWKKKTLEPVDANNLGKYTTELSNGDIFKFNRICFKLLEKFNYEV